MHLKRSSAFNIYRIQLRHLLVFKLYVVYVFYVLKKWLTSHYTIGNSFKLTNDFYFQN